MTYSVDIDKYGSYGIHSGKKITIYNLKEGNIDIEDNCTNVINKRIVARKTILGNNSHLNAIFMSEDDDYRLGYSNIIKFGLHSRVIDNFINVRGNSILFGNINKENLEYLSNQMLNINSFDWSPHFSTGTFVTTSEDALVRISDIRSKNSDYSFLSFYNTTRIKWNPLNFYLLAGLHENGSFLSIYDIRFLKSVGIIPRYLWCNNKYSKVNKDCDLCWLPLSSNKILINDVDSIGILDISCALNSSRIITNGDLNNSQIFIQEKSRFRKIEFYEPCSLDETEEKYFINREDNDSDKIVKPDFDLNINTFDFIPGTNTLIIHNKNNGELFSCKVTDNTKNLRFNKINFKLLNSVSRLFIRNEDNLIYFTDLNKALINNIEKKTNIDLLIKNDKYLSELCRYKDKKDFLDLLKICLEWFLRDVNNIYEKVNGNQKIADNLLSLSIESNERTIIKLSKHPTLRTKFIIEDNSQLSDFLVKMDSFELNVLLNIPQNKNRTILITYYITENTVFLLNDFIDDILSNYDKVSLNNFENNELFCLHEEFLQNSDYHKLKCMPGNCMQNVISPIPMRIFVDGMILENKEFNRINDIFQIKMDGRKFKYQDDKLQYTSYLLDWVSIFSNWPHIVFKNEFKVDVGIKNDLDLISITNRIFDNFGDQVSSNKFLNKTVSFTFHDLDKFIISNSNYLLITRINGENSNKSERFERIITDIKNLLRRVYYISDMRFAYGDFYSYTFVLFNWLIKVIYNENRKRAVYDIQHYYLNSTNKSNYKYINMFFSPTSLHTYFIKREQLKLNKEEFVELSEIYRSNSDNIYRILMNNRALDRNQLVFLLRELYLEIRNNYYARILVVAIEKLFIYMEDSKENARKNNIKSSSICYVCFERVYGLYTHCTKCRHGGHNRHIKDWFMTNDMCPETNCRCSCKSE